MAERTADPRTGGDDDEVAALYARLEQARGNYRDRQRKTRDAALSVHPSVEPAAPEDARGALEPGELALVYVWSPQYVGLMIVPSPDDGEVAGHVVARGAEEVKRLREALRVDAAACRTKPLLRGSGVAPTPAALASAAPRGPPRAPSRTRSASSSCWRGRRTTCRSRIAWSGCPRRSSACRPSPRSATCAASPPRRRTQWTSATPSSSPRRSSPRTRGARGARGTRGARAAAERAGNSRATTSAPSATSARSTASGCSAARCPPSPATATRRP